jgi:hypothetical protein
MKSLTLFLLISAISSSAQVTVNCDYKQFCYWNNQTENFDSCNGYEDNILIELNKAETIITRIDQIMKSTYFISKKDFYKDKNIWVFYTKSDLGNDCIFYFDPKNNQIRAVYMVNGKSMLIVYRIKNIF